MTNRAFSRMLKTSRPRAIAAASMGSMSTCRSDGGVSEPRYAARSATCSSVGLVPCMVVTIDLRIWSSSRAIEPVQVHGPVAATPSSEGTRLGAPYDPSPSVSLKRLLVWPSVWQL